MEFIQVSRKHLSGLNELIRTQYRLLKLKIPLAGDRRVLEQLNGLFSDWSRANSNLLRLYDELDMGTICMEEKHHQEQRMKELSSKLEAISQTVNQMQFEKDALEANCLRMKKEMEEQDVRMSLQNAELNKLSQEKSHLAARLAQANAASKKQKKEEAESLRLYKEKYDSLKSKYAELDGRYRVLEELHRGTERNKDDELDRELRQLEQLAEAEDSF